MPDDMAPHATAPMPVLNVLPEENFLVDLEGFDGPLDLLLDLARNQKVDLAQISVVKLADQYLNYIEQAKSLRLEVAADYLVMAAWLTYLKSRLLIPDPPREEEELSPQMMADLLTFQLKRIEAMRNAGYNLFRQPIFGRDIFGRPAHVRSLIKTQLSFDLKLHDLLHSYGQIMAERQAAFYRPAPRKLYKLEDAMERLRLMLGLAREWTSFGQFMPPDLFDDVVVKRSAVASTFGACLELAKQGAMDLNQEKPFAPIYIRQIIYEGDNADDEQ